VSRRVQHRYRKPNAPFESDQTYPSVPPWPYSRFPVTLRLSLKQSLKDSGSKSSIPCWCVCRFQTCLLSVASKHAGSRLPKLIASPRLSHAASTRPQSKLQLQTGAAVLSDRVNNSRRRFLPFKTQHLRLVVSGPASYILTRFSTSVTARRFTVPGLPWTTDLYRPSRYATGCELTYCGAGT
jgi:hypothetical protein